MNLRASRSAQVVLVLVANAMFQALPAGLASDGARGEPIADFRLRDSGGQEHALGDFAEASFVVVAFLGTECPLARLYAPRLEQLSREYAPRQVQFLGIDSNVQDTAAKLAEFVRHFDLSFPVLRDPDASLADALGAERTPEVFVLDGQRRVRYRGRIDDQFGIGVQKPAASRRDLAEALDELLAGNPVSQPNLPAAGCRIGRVRTADPSGEVTWSDGVADILARRCIECHREGEIGPFSLTNYEDAAAWGQSLLEAVEAKRMPPWFADPEHGRFANENRLTDAEQERLQRWVAAGCPPGIDPPELTFVSPDASREQSADVVIPMSDHPFRVPADGVVDYQYYVVDPGWTEDQWVAHVDVRPGNRAVVHHILVFVVRPDSIYPPIYPGELIGGYVPGLRGIHYPESMAMRLPAGSRIVFQMHYTPNGIACDDLSSIGLRLADPSEVTHEVKAEKAINILFQIPPRAADYEAQAGYTFVADGLLLSLIPHMHLRGKSFRYEAHYPDGRSEVLLQVPRYDFNWQLEYILDEPKPMPAGTRLVCTATFDNSVDNPANPDPDRWVTFGEQTWEEMLIGFFVVAEDRHARGSRAATLIDAADSARRLFRDLREPRPWTAQMLRVVEEADKQIRYAQRRGRLTRTPVLQEVGHVLWSGVAEAEKQQVLADGPQPVSIRRGLPFLKRMGKALDAIGEESGARKD